MRSGSDPLLEIYCSVKQLVDTVPLTVDRSIMKYFGLMEASPVWLYVNMYLMFMDLWGDVKLKTEDEVLKTNQTFICCVNLAKKK